MVLVARGEDALEDVAEECRALGVDVTTVATDVAVGDGVAHVVETAVARHGRVDIWVNNAALVAFGRMDEIPMNDLKRVLDVNLIGYLHGARSVLPVFRRQGAGTLINVGSALSEASQPILGSYVISKHAVRALSMVLRQELTNTKDIHVCTIMPATVDTPLFNIAANYTGHAIRPIPPVYPPERVARTIVRCAKRPRRETYAGGVAGPLVLLQRLVPAFTERAMTVVTEHVMLAADPVEPTAGNLYAPAGIDGPTSAEGPRRLRSRWFAVGAVAAAVGAASVVKKLRSH